MHALTRTACAAAAPLLPATTARAEPPIAVVTVVGPAEVVFSAKRDACDGNDVPDAPLRAFRDADGQVAAFGLHYVNRALRGPNLDALKIDCRGARFGRQSGSGRVRRAQLDQRDLDRRRCDRAGTRPP